MADLLSPNGTLVCLEFPLYKDPKLPGPPWGLNGVYWNLLVQGGTGIVAENDENAKERIWLECMLRNIDEQYYY